MRFRYAALYVSIGVALGLWLHAAAQTPDAQAERLAPASPSSSSAYA